MRTTENIQRWLCCFSWGWANLECVLQFGLCYGFNPLYVRRLSITDGVCSSLHNRPCILNYVIYMASSIMPNEWEFSEIRGANFDKLQIATCTRTAAMCNSASYHCRKSMKVMNVHGGTEPQITYPYRTNRQHSRDSNVKQHAAPLLFPILFSAQFISLGGKVDSVKRDSGARSSSRKQKGVHPAIVNQPACTI